MAEKTEEKKFELVEVPTQHTIAVRTPEGEILTVEQLLVNMMNELKEIKKLIG